MLRLPTDEPTQPLIQRGLAQPEGGSVEPTGQPDQQAIFTARRADHLHVLRQAQVLRCCVRRKNSDQLLVGGGTKERGSSLGHGVIQGGAGRTVRGE